MSGLTPKITCRWVSNGQLANPKRGTACWIQRRSDSYTQKVVERPSELSIHLVLSQGGSKDRVQHFIHPSKALAITQEFHRQTSCSQNYHARNEFSLWNEVIQACKEKSKAGMQYFPSKIRGIAILRKQQKVENKS